MWEYLRIAHAKGPHKGRCVLQFYWLVFPENWKLMAPGTNLIALLGTSRFTPHDWDWYPVTVLDGHRHAHSLAMRIRLSGMCIRL